MNVLGEPCIKYVQAFKESEVKVTKMETTIAGNKVKAEVMQFSGKEGVEGLFMTLDQFRHAANCNTVHQGVITQ